MVKSGGAPTAVNNSPPGKLAAVRRTGGPVLFLSILGQPADDLLRVCTSFKYKRSLKKAAETDFEFRDDNGKLGNDVRLYPNQTWRFRFGYFNDISPILVGVIREFEPEYKDKRTVHVKLYDATLNLAISSQAKNWGAIPSSEIAKRIAKAANMEALVEDSKDTPKKAWMQPGDMNDLAYLRDLSVAIDYEVFVTGSPPVLIYRKKPYGAAPVRTLTYYDDYTEFSGVKSFKPKVKGLGPLKTGASGTNDKTGKADKASTASGDKANSALAGYAVEVVGESGRAAVIIEQTGTRNSDGTTKPTPSGSNNLQIAHAARQQMLDNCNEANSEHCMSPSLQAGKTFIWAGLAKQLNGKWYTEEESHELTGSGSSSKLTWKRNSKNDALNKDGKDSKNSKTNNKDSDGRGAPAVEVSGNTGFAAVTGGV